MLAPSKIGRQRQQISRARDAWKQFLGTSGTWVFVIDNKALTGQKVLDLWLNGHYFHNDADKMTAWNDEIGKMLSRMYFLAVVPSLTSVIMHLDAIIRDGLVHNLFDLSST